MGALDLSNIPDSTGTSDPKSDLNNDREMPVIGKDAPKEYARKIQERVQVLETRPLEGEDNLERIQFDPKSVFCDNTPTNWTTSHSLLIEEWEGKVVKVLDNKFIAHLFKPNAELTEALEGEFEFDSVPAGDRRLIKEGMLFYWNIGREIRRGGSISHGDYLLVRRIPAWKDFNAENPDPIADNFFNFD